MLRSTAEDIIFFTNKAIVDLIFKLPKRKKSMNPWVRPKTFRCWASLKRRAQSITQSRKIKTVNQPWVEIHRIMKQCWKISPACCPKTPWQARRAQSTKIWESMFGTWLAYVGTLRGSSMGQMYSNSESEIRMWRLSSIMNLISAI